MDEKEIKSMQGNKLNMSKEDAERWVKYGEIIERLQNNQDFVTLMKVYTESEVLRSAYLLADEDIAMAQNKQQIRDGIIDNIMACARFRNYISYEIPRLKDIAENTLQGYSEEQ